MTEMLIYVVPDSSFLDLEYRQTKLFIGKSLAGRVTHPHPCSPPPLWPGVTWGVLAMRMWAKVRNYLWDESLKSGCTFSTLSFPIPPLNGQYSKDWGEATLLNGLRMAVEQSLPVPQQTVTGMWSDRDIHVIALNQCNFRVIHYTA